MPSYNWKITPEPFVISTDPSVWKIEKEELVEKNNVGIFIANNNIIKIDNTNSLVNASTYLYVGLGGVLFILFLSLLAGETATIDYYYIFFPVFFIALFNLLIYLFTGRKYLILDRENSKLTYPQYYFKKKPITIDFNKTRAVISYASNGSTIGTKLSIENRLPGSLLNGKWLLSKASEIEYWSFMVWYMDKNRPLPPGTAFDAYRKEDFERRKAEGFPKPLYPSHIKTLEATKEQQDERKRIGGW